MCLEGGREEALNGFGNLDSWDPQACDFAKLLRGRWRLLQHVYTHGAVSPVFHGTLEFRAVSLHEILESFVEMMIRVPGVLDTLKILVHVSIDENNVRANPFERFVHCQRRIVVKRTRQIRGNQPAAVWVVSEAQPIMLEA